MYKTCPWGIIYLCVKLREARSFYVLDLVSGLVAGFCFFRCTKGQIFVTAGTKSPRKIK